MSRRGNEDGGLGERVKSGLGGLFGRASSRAGQGADRLRHAARALGGGSLLQQALAARERGNLEAAFWLLDEAWRADPDDLEVAGAFWDVAVSLDRAMAAAGAGAALVERHADKEPDLAAQYFAELAGAEPEALVRPTALARILPVLRERADKAGADEREEAMGLLGHALRLAVDVRNEGLSPGVAFRLYREGRDADPRAGRRAAEVALASPDLHPAKRAEIEGWLAGEDSALAPDEEPEPSPLRRRVMRRVKSAPEAPPEPPAEPLSDAEIAAAAERLPPPSGERLALESPSRAGREILHGVPLELADDALALLIPGRGESRLGWDEIEAVSVAEIDGLASDPVLVIDCILNWSRRASEPLRLVRLRGDAFDPMELVGVADSPLRTMLVEVFERSRAIPLPDPDSALGLRPAAFESLSEYERDVLGFD